MEGDDQTYLCLHCGEGELERHEEAWLRCEACGRVFAPEDVLAHLATREDPRWEGWRGTWAESVHRKVSPGGSEDGMATIPHRVYADDSIVDTASEVRSEVLQVPRLDADTTEVRQAMRAWMTDPPQAHELARLAKKEKLSSPRYRGKLPQD